LLFPFVIITGHASGALLVEVSKKELENIALDLKYPLKGKSPRKRDNAKPQRALAPQAPFNSPHLH
jgi:hypothetical protein